MDWRMRTATLLALATLLPPAGVRPLRYQEVPEAIRASIAPNAASFGGLLERMESRTSERLARGEEEHLVYYVLQSSAFTRRARIEPALSAKEVIESGRVPEAARARMRDFLAALKRPSQDPRLAHYRDHFRGTGGRLEAAYREAMRFLYSKEFGAGGPGVYQTRGHSSDTSLAPCFTVWNALAVLRSLAPGARLDRVLIVGPGLDFAPRTDLRDDVPPQSYQPYLTARALLEWKLADASRLEVDCVDINPRVVRFIGNRNTVLALPRETGNADFLEYVRGLGPRIEVPAVPVRAVQFNILTQRFDPPRLFDLVIATNVLVYFDALELKLALANIHAMLKPGGWLIHNELRPELEEISAALGMPPVQGRTLEIAKGAKAPLMDAFAIHRRN